MAVPAPPPLPPQPPLVDLTMARKFLCVVCKRKFRRVRDLQTHTNIMHKQMSDAERELMRQEIEKTNQMLANYRRMLKSSRRSGAAAAAAAARRHLAAVSNAAAYASSSHHHVQQQQHQLVTIDGHQSQMLANKVCPVCNKVFKNDNTTNKTFMRHLQIQHGLSEK